MTVFALVLLGSGEVVIDQTKAASTTASKLGFDSKNNDKLGVINLVHLGDLLLQFFLGDARNTAVNDLDDLEETNYEKNILETLNKFNIEYKYKLHTNCFLWRRGLDMNLRVRTVTASAMLMVC